MTPRRDGDTTPRREGDERPSNPGASSRRLAGQGAARTRPGPGRSPATGTGAGGGSAKTGQAATTYRGVRWQRNTAGRLRWHDDDGGRWVLWRPGQDAPPRPPGWADPDRPVGTPLRDKRARAPWRSPYRLVPLALAVAIVIFGIVQATSSTTSSSGDAAAQAAQKLLGQCLATAGTSNGQPIYEAGPVACGSSKAAVKVERVLVGPTAAAHCPTADRSVRLADPGAASPPVLCVSSVRH